MTNVSKIEGDNVPNTKNQKVAEAVRVILAELNGGNVRRIAEVINETVQADHRTLQQAFWSALLLAQIAYSDAPYDLRNDVAVEFAKRLKVYAVTVNVDMGFPYI